MPANSIFPFLLKNGRTCVGQYRIKRFYFCSAIKTKHQMKSIQTELLHVLLADDDAEDRNLFSAILKRTNIPAGLTEFKNAMDLLKYLENPENTIPDFIFLDINMPVMNGKECLREIRKKPLHRYVPVIICSTTNYKQDIDETFADGANLFVPKNT